MQKCTVPTYNQTYPNLNDPYLTSPNKQQKARQTQDKPITNSSRRYQIVIKGKKLKKETDNFQNTKNDKPVVKEDKCRTTLCFNSHTQLYVKLKWQDKTIIVKWTFAATKYPNVTCGLMGHCQVFSFAWLLSVALYHLFL